MIASAHRSPDERDRQEAQKARRPIVHERYVMAHVERYFLVQFTRDKESMDLPHIVIQARPTPAFFPEPRPWGQIGIHKVSVRYRLLRGGPFDRLPIILARDHPNLVEPRDLQNPVPPHAGFGPLIRLARIG